MLVLALDTATAHASIALLHRGRQLSAWREKTHQDLCRRLAAEARRVLSQAGRTFPDLGLVAVGLGPGSFTSLRVGLATAKGIALARDLPLVGVSSLEAMAWQARGQVSGMVCPLLDARRGEVYAGLFRLSGEAVERVEEEFVASGADLVARLAALGEPVSVFGEVESLSAADREALGDTVLARPAWPDAAAVAELALSRFASRGGDDLPSLRPIYVRRSYAEEAQDLDLGLR